MISFQNYRFLPAEAGDAEDVFALIRSRIRWMDEHGIRQWNAEGYWHIFPESYYLAAIREGRLFVLKSESGEIAAAGVLSSADEHWQDGVPALYLHNFAADECRKGAGRLYLQYCENYARRAGKKYFRLDCSENNEKLNFYYETLGYTAAGRVQEGGYFGIKREKKL